MGDPEPHESTALQCAIELEVALPFVGDLSPATAKFLHMSTSSLRFSASPDNMLCSLFAVREAQTMQDTSSTQLSSSLMSQHL